MVCVRAKLGLGEISLKHAVDDFLRGYILKLKFGFVINSIIKPI